MISRRWKPHISLKSSFLRYADSIILCPMSGFKTMATACLFTELVSEICGFHRPELTHCPQLLLYNYYAYNIKCFCLRFEKIRKVLYKYLMQLQIDTRMQVYGWFFLNCIHNPFWWWYWLQCLCTVKCTWRAGLWLTWFYDLLEPFSSGGYIVTWTGPDTQPLGTW